MAGFFVTHMKKNKGVRLAADKDGNIEVTFTLPAESVAKAEEWAARLPSTREEIIKRYVLDCAKTMHEGMHDYCLVSWTFPTKKAAQSFVEREKLDQRGIGVIAWDGGGFGVDTLYHYDKALTH
jgi:hypothetical protein